MRRVHLGRHLRSHQRHGEKGMYDVRQKSARRCTRARRTPDVCSRMTMGPCCDCPLSLLDDAKRLRWTRSRRARRRSSSAFRCRVGHAGRRVSEMVVALDDVPDVSACMLPIEAVASLQGLGRRRRRRPVLSPRQRRARRPGRGRDAIASIDTVHAGVTVENAAIDQGCAQLPRAARARARAETAAGRTTRETI